MSLNDDWINRQARIREARKRLDKDEINRKYAKALQREQDAKAEAKAEAKRQAKRDAKKADAKADAKRQAKRDARRGK